MVVKKSLEKDVLRVFRVDGKYIDFVRMRTELEIDHKELYQGLAALGVLDIQAMEFDEHRTCDTNLHSVGQQMERLKALKALALHGFVTEDEHKATVPSLYFGTSAELYLEPKKCRRE